MRALGGPNQSMSIGRGELRGVDLSQFIYQRQWLRRGYLDGFRGTNGGFIAKNGRVVGESY